MKLRILRGSLLVVSLVSISACPPNRKISPGVWLFEINGGLVIAMILHADGSTETPNPLPPEAGTFFVGNLTWYENVGGTYFQMTQTSGSNSWNYHTDLGSDTSLTDGNWLKTSGGIDSGTWIAEKL